MTVLVPAKPRPRSDRGRFIIRQRDTSLDRWRVMALLVEALFRRQVVRLHDCRPIGVPTSLVRAVFNEAGMQQTAPGTWLTGYGTYDWLLYWYHAVPSSTHKAPL